jgi:endonuclease YncB( thermonuclease family)
MRRKWATAGFLGLLIFVASLFPTFAGDSLYGRVTAVRSADAVVFDYGAGQYNIRIVGIDPPQQGRLADEARQFVSNLVLDKNVRIRFEQRAANGEMVARLFTDDPAIGIREVGVELLRNGLARREPNYDYKYGELSAAENEAQAARRGLWTAAPP